MVLRTTNEQPSLWESVLPEEALSLPAELERVDALLDDPAFVAPFAAHFDPVMGRPSIPIETYLRLMFLKFRYHLGYETLCREVADSISWQRFCRIPLGRRVPDATTLMKLTSRCGPEVIEALNDALLAKASAEGVGHPSGAGRHHRGRGQRGLSHRLGAVGQSGGPPHPPGQTGSGRWRGDTHQGA